MTYTAADGAEAKERCGLYHLVHGWTQRGHKNDVSTPTCTLLSLTPLQLYLCSDYTRSGTAYIGVTAHYRLNALMAEMLAIMFEGVFPDIYRKYKSAFDAGVWIKTDPGPWLGRAIVYKLQLTLHVDANDVGPAASFPSGLFEGGALVIPQMLAKFA